MCTIFTPARLLNISVASWLIDPPGAALLSSPGRDFASAMNCFRLFTGSAACTTRKRPVRASVATGAKSLIESNGSGALVRYGTSTCELPGSSSVCPSGGDFSSASEAMTVLPPGRLSTIACWPSVSVSFGARWRARMSFVPPGLKGMMMRIGLLGNACCAPASPAQAESRSTAADARGWRKEAARDSPWFSLAHRTTRPPSLSSRKLTQSLERVPSSTCKCLKDWWARLDSNQGPRDYEFWARLGANV